LRPILPSIGAISTQRLSRQLPELEKKRIRPQNRSAKVE
jgi:hypothetical protein